jgi:hypothetical protein
MTCVTCTNTTSWSTLRCKMDARHGRIASFYRARRTLFRCELFLAPSAHATRAVRPGPLHVCGDPSLTINATPRTHRNFHSCLGSAQAAIGPFTSPRRPRAINRALLRLFRRSQSPCSRSPQSPSSCDPSSLLHTLLPHDASHLQAMSSPVCPPTTARPRAPGW